MALSESQLIWKKIKKSESEDLSIWENYIEKLEIKEQKRILRWQLQAREPIHSISEMKAGDHLVKKNSLPGGMMPYEHHFICIGSDCEGERKIIHYYNTRRNAIAQLFPTSASAQVRLLKIWE